MNLSRHGNGAISRKSHKQFFQLLFYYIYTHLHLCMRIFIIGFMGTGKSHWSMQWAKVNNMQFFDLDALIEEEEEASVVDIFEKEGEDYFRIKEAAKLRYLLKNDNCIISCGGGAPCFTENMQCMNDNGITVYLAASPTYILQNVLLEKEKRPIIKNINEAELLFFIEQKLKERAPFYNQANLTLNAETLNADSLAPVMSQQFK